jgi:hypothetical protein
MMAAHFLQTNSDPHPVLSDLRVIIKMEVLTVMDQTYSEKRGGSQICKDLIDKMKT